MIKTLDIGPSRTLAPSQFLIMHCPPQSTNLSYSWSILTWPDYSVEYGNKLGVPAPVLKVWPHKNMWLHPSWIGPSTRGYRVQLSQGSSHDSWLMTHESLTVSRRFSLHSTAAFKFNTSSVNSTLFTNSDRLWQSHSHWTTLDRPDHLSISCINSNNTHFYLFYFINEFSLTHPIVTLLVITMLGVYQHRIKIQDYLVGLSMGHY